MERVTSTDLVQYRLSERTRRSVLHLYWLSRRGSLPTLPFKDSGLSVHAADEDGVELRIESTVRSGDKFIWDEWMVDVPVLLQWLRYVNTDDLHQRATKYQVNAPGVQNAEIFDKTERVLRLNFSDVQSAHIFATALRDMSVPVKDDDLSLLIAIPWTSPLV